MNLATGRLEKCGKNKKKAAQSGKSFEDFTVAELRQVVEKQQADENRRPEMDVKVADLMALDEDISWVDGLHIFEDDNSGASKPAEELLSLNWKSEPVAYGNSRWVRVESVMDSGASAPVAPPTMMPNVKVVPSEGSRRGQRWSSASKHKIDHLGEQHLKACTEEGDETEVLFQIASVSTICERGNRVIFGRNGGVVQNLQSGKLIPFQRRNGIYILSLWLEDSGDSDFHRP